MASLWRAYRRVRTERDMPSGVTVYDVHLSPLGKVYEAETSLQAYQMAREVYFEIWSDGELVVEPSLALRMPGI